MRQVPPTIFPTDTRTLLRASLGGASAEQSARVRDDAVRALSDYFSRPALALTDSGTGALTLALTIAAAARGHEASRLLVALPSYGCIDVPTAVMGADARAIGYDLDPATLGPDEGTLRAALQAGAGVVIISHLFGHPVPLAEWRTECERHGAILIEDAAQWAGGREGDVPLGRSGHMAILSLGRGKGLVGTGGGVLLGGESFAEAIGRTPSVATRLHSLETLDHRGHLGIALKGSGAALLGRPGLYGLPASIPMLRLGEMVFHAPRAAESLSVVSARLLPHALAAAEAGRRQRARLAQHYADALSGRRGLGALPVVSPDTTPGVLRQAVLLHASSPLPKSLGVVRPYAVPLVGQSEIASVLVERTEMPGAQALADRLVTLPVHSQVAPGDLQRLCHWLATPLS